MQIWKFQYMFSFIWKQYPENFAFLILRILKLFSRKVCIFLRKYANFQQILLFLYACKQIFHISYVRITQKVNDVIKWNLRYIIYFDVKLKIYVGFQICISVPLRQD